MTDMTVPARATLPAGRAVTPTEAYAALGITRMTARRWRNGHGLPGAARRGDMIDTQALAAWLAAKGCRVEWST